MVRLDDAGRIRAAYPFSGVPTAHRVAIAGGPTMFAMCAIDALGMVGASAGDAFDPAIAALLAHEAAAILDLDLERPAWEEVLAVPISEQAVKSC